MDMVSLGALAITATLCAVFIKQNNQELGLLLALAACTLLLAQTLPALQIIRESLDELAQAAGLSDAVLIPVLKTVGLAVVTKLAAELCRDAKENGVAAFVEAAGTAAAILVALPLLHMVLQLIGGLL